MSSDSYSSYTAYSWNLDKRITVQEALNLRDRGGRGSRAGDCACHKKCYQNKTHQVVFPRRCTDRRSHFVRNKRYTSRGCGIRSQVNRVNEDTGRNNYFEQFLSDLYYYLAGSGGMSVPGQNLSGPKHLHDIQSVAIATSRSADSPDITITHGFRTARDRTHIFIVNTSRNRLNTSEPECTKFNTIFIDILRWPEGHIADFEKWGVRKFNEEMKHLEKTIEKEQRRKDAERERLAKIEKALIDSYRGRIGHLIAAGKLTQEWASWFDLPPSDEAVKSSFEENRDSIEDLESQVIKEEQERKAAKEEQERIARQELIFERERRISRLSTNSTLSLSLQGIIPDSDGYEFSPLLEFCLIFSEYSQFSIEWSSYKLNNPLGSWKEEDMVTFSRRTQSPLEGYITQYLFVEDPETTQEQFLEEVLEHNLLVPSGINKGYLLPAATIRSQLQKTDPGLTSFGQINEFLEKEIERISNIIQREELDRLRSSFESIFGVQVPDDWKDESEIIATRISQKGEFRKLWSEYESVLGTRPTKREKFSRSQLTNKISLARNTKRAEERIENLPSLIDQLRKELSIVMEKIPDEQLADRSVFNEWQAIIDFSIELLDARSQSIVSGGYDRSPISTFIVSEVSSMKKLQEEVEQFHSLPIVRVAGERNPIRALPWRKIDTANNLTTPRIPNPIRVFAELYDAIEEGIDNLSHVSDYLDRAIPRWSEEAKIATERAKIIEKQKLAEAKAKEAKAKEAEEQKKLAEEQKKLAARSAKRKRKTKRRIGTSRKTKEAAEQKKLAEAKAKKAKMLENYNRYQEKIDEKNRKKEEARLKKVKAKDKQILQEAAAKAKMLENSKRFQEKLDEKNRKKEEDRQKAKAKAEQILQEGIEKAEAAVAREQAARSANRIRKVNRRIGTSRKTKNK